MPGGPNDGGVADAIFIYVTHPDAAAAASLGRALVESRLAACANILPGMQTVYRWQGEIETATEAVMIVKTHARLFDAVAAHVRSNHPYACPCIVALPVIAGEPAYLAWLASCLGAAA